MTVKCLTSETNSGSRFWESMVLWEILCIAANKATSQLLTTHLCPKATEVASLPEQTAEQHQHCTLINPYTHRLTKISAILTAPTKLAENHLTKQNAAIEALHGTIPFLKEREQQLTSFQFIRTNGQPQICALTSSISHS